MCDFGSSYAVNKHTIQYNTILYIYVICKKKNSCSIIDILKVGDNSARAMLGCKHHASPFVLKKRCNSNFRYSLVISELISMLYPFLSSVVIFIVYFVCICSPYFVLFVCFEFVMVYYCTSTANNYTTTDTILCDCTGQILMAYLSW